MIMYVSVCVWLCERGDTLLFEFLYPLEKLSRIALLFIFHICRITKIFSTMTHQGQEDKNETAETN